MKKGKGKINDVIVSLDFNLFMFIIAWSIALRKYKTRKNYFVPLFYQESKFLKNTIHSRKF